VSRDKRRPDNRSQRDRRPARRRRFGWWIAGVTGLAIIVAGGWLAVRDREAPPAGTVLPGPAGGREVAQDVNTLVGQRAPSFSLPTAEGRTHTVPPGRDRPTVLIFHMGIG